MLFVALLRELTERSRKNTHFAQKGFAVFDVRKAKDVLGKECDEVILSQEQAQELFRWLGEKLHGVRITKAN